MKNFKRVFILSGLAILLFSSMAFAGDSTSMNLKYRNIEAKAEGSVNKMESGVAQTNKKVVIPGKWAKMPKIVVSPKSLGVYEEQYNYTDQQVIVDYENLSMDSNGVVSFVPKAQLIVSGGVIPDDSINISTSRKWIDRDNDFSGGTSWSNGYRTQNHVTRMVIYGKLECNFSGLFFYGPDKVVLKAYVNVDGKQYCACRKTIKNGKKGTYTKSFAFTTPPLPAGRHNIEVRGTIRVWDPVNFSPILKVSASSLQLTLSSFSNLTGGSLNWVAIGEGAD